MSNPGHEFTRLVEIMRTLRSPEGCPWDRAQTLGSLTEFVLEEAHEVVDAIERDDLVALGEEIGDHIFEGVFLAQIAAEMGAFTVTDALRAVADKLVRRHPHVFQPDGRVHDAASKERAPSADAALSRWDTQKAQERGGAAAPDGALGSLPGSLPALLMAAQARQARRLRRLRLDASRGGRRQDPRGGRRSGGGCGPHAAGARGCRRRDGRSAVRRSRTSRASSVWSRKPRCGGPTQSFGNASARWREPSPDRAG